MPSSHPSLGLSVFFLSFWARDWRALALTQVHHWSRLSDSREDGEALSSVHSTALAAGKRIHINAQLRTQDAQAPTVEKGERDSNDSQKSALGPRKANAMTASSVSSS